MKDNAKDEGAERLGVSDFLKFIYDGQPEWSLLAVKAPMDEGSEEWADFRGAHNVSRDVPREPGKEYDDMGSHVAVVQVKGNPWTIIFRSLQYVDERQMEGVVEDAKELSARLSTRAISFLGEDTSGAIAYKLFEKGKV